jgi:hypothetical protein
MSRVHPLLPLILLMPLTGCAVGNFPTTSPPTTQSISGNWEITSGTPASPSSIVVLTGAIAQQGTAVTATFQTIALCGTPPVVNFSGTFDANRNLTLTATPVPEINVKLDVPPDPGNVAVGTLGASGLICALALESPAIGFMIPPVTGTYTGTVTASTINPTPPAISTIPVTLTVTQASTANSSGQFPLTGTLGYSGGGCTGSIPLAGSISGSSFLLQTTSSLQQGQAYASVIGIAVPTSPSLSSVSIEFVNSPCSTSPPSAYSGTLTPQ